MSIEHIESKIVADKIKIDEYMQSAHGMQKLYEALPYMRALEEHMESYMKSENAETDTCCMIYTYLGDCFAYIPYFPSAVDAYTKALGCAVKSKDETVRGEITELVYKIAKYRNIIARDRFYADNSSVKGEHEKAAYDDCVDIQGMISGCMKKDRAHDIVRIGAQTAKKTLLADAVEHTEEYLNALYDMHCTLQRELADTSRDKGFCHVFWAAKKVYLARVGICWSSPAVLNPGTKFE